MPWWRQSRKSKTQRGGSTGSRLCREERSGSHTRDKVLSGMADGSWWVGRHLEIPSRAPLEATGHWLVLQIIIGNVTLVILNTSFPSFLH